MGKGTPEGGAGPFPDVSGGAGKRIVRPDAPNNLVGTGRVIDDVSGNRSKQREANQRTDNVRNRR